MSTYTYKSLPLVALAALSLSPAYSKDLEAEIKAVDSKVIAWRRDFHQNPELSYEEVRTARIVAAHLRSLRLEVRTGVAQTGVVGAIAGAARAAPPAEQEPPK